MLEPLIEISYITEKIRDSGVRQGIVVRGVSQAPNTLFRAHPQQQKKGGRREGARGCESHVACNTGSGKENNRVCGVVTRNYGGAQTLSR